MDDGPALDDDERMYAADENDDHIESWDKIVPQDGCERELEQVFVLRPNTRCPRYPQSQEDQSGQSDDKAGADACTDDCEKARTACCSADRKKDNKNDVLLTSASTAKPSWSKHPVRKRSDRRASTILLPPRDPLLHMPNVTPPCPIQPGHLQTPLEQRSYTHVRKTKKLCFYKLQT